MNTQNPTTPRPCHMQAVKSLLESNKEALADLLPRHIRPERLMRVVLTQMAKNPTLQDCTQASLFGSILQSSSLGLEPDGVEGALIPYRISGVMTATFQPMYQGLIKLAHMGGQIKVLYGEVVHENDEFGQMKGLDPYLNHVPASSDRGAIIGAYAVYHLVNGGKDFEYMTKEEIEKVRASSRAKKDSPWNHWWEEMAKKTVLKRLMKRLPRSREMMDAIAIDNEAGHGKGSLDMSGAFAGTGIEIPEDNPPAIAEPEPAEPEPQAPENAQEPPPDSPPVKSTEDLMFGGDDHENNPE